MNVIPLSQYLTRAKIYKDKDNSIDKLAKSMDKNNVETMFARRVAEALERSRLLAKELGKRVSAKPHKSCVCVLDNLEEIEIEEAFIKGFQKYFPPLKSYTNQKIHSLAQFIRSNGGINYSVERVRDYLNITTLNYSETVVDYANIIYGSLQDIRNASLRRRIKKKNFVLPYCAFCWRRIEDSDGYCQIHHPNQSKKAYYKAKSALEFAAQNDDFTYSYEFKNYKKFGIRGLVPYSRYAFKWTGSFAEHPTSITTDLIKIDISKDNYLEIINIILKFTDKHYPLTFTLLKSISIPEFHSWEDFILAVITALDPLEAVFWEARDLKNWINPESDTPNPLVLLMVFQRHEAYQYINQLPRPRGPKKNSPNSGKKIDLRERIRNLITLQKNEGRKINRSEIARELNLSRQRISIIIKELKAE